MSEGHGQTEVRPEKVSEESLLTLNSGLNSLQYFLGEFSFHSLEVNVCILVPIFASRHQLIKGPIRSGA